MSEENLKHKTKVGMYWTFLNSGANQVITFVVGIIMADFAAEHLPNFISARHDASVKAWAEDRGFKYLCAHTAEEAAEGAKVLTDLSVEGPVILEVFSDMLEDTKIFKNYYATIRQSRIEELLQNKSESVIQKVIRTLDYAPNAIKVKIAQAIGPNRVQAAKTLIKG